jgi:hypothetical protein
LRHFGKLIRRQPPQVRYPHSGNYNVCGLVPFAAMWLRGQVRTICLNNDSIKRHDPNNFAQRIEFAVRKSDLACK